ncbi:MAG: phosphoglycolate phosphatase [Desulfurococcaceae archaeon]
MRRFKALFLDIDGTLTVDRKSYALDLEAVEAVRSAVGKGITVCLVSSNALPIVVGLSRYLGLNGVAIGESGSIVYMKGKVVALASKPAKEPYRALLDRYGDFVEDTWQNYFRLYEFALKLREKYHDNWRNIVRELREYVEQRYPGFTVDYSGYALHVREADVDKRRAVLFVLEKLGIKPEEAAGVGDSVMDVSFLSVLGLSAAVSNADDELKSSVNLVLTKPSGKGVAEFIYKYLGV